MNFRRFLRGWLLFVVVFLGSAVCQDQPPQPQGHAQTQSSRNAQPPLTGNKHQIKRGSRDDVDAIGTRKMEGMNWYSTSKEIELGKQAAQELETEVKFVDDPVITEYVNRVGQELVRNSDAKVPFSVKVVDSDEVAAFAFPGGFLYVNSGLLLAADNEAELAGMMAHAVAHVAARHVTRLMTRQQIAGYMQTPLIMTANNHCNIYPACEHDQTVGLPVAMLKFERLMELEADYFGVQYLYKAGYEPNAFLAFLEKRDQLMKSKPSSSALAFAAHPPLAERIQKAKKEIAAILPARDHATVETLEFQQVKARMATLSAKNKNQN